MNLLTPDQFWLCVTSSIVEGLYRPAPHDDDQLHVVLRRLGDVVHAPRRVRRAIAGETELSKAVLDEFVRLLRRSDPLVGRQCAETARALALLYRRGYGGTGGRQVVPARPAG